MTAGLEAGGWVVAGLTGLLALATRRALADRMEGVARACHELRGPLTTVRLALAVAERGGELTSHQLRAIDTELGRAGQVLDDLGEMRRRRVDGSGSRDLGRVDVLALLSDVLEAAQPAGARVDVRLSGWWDGPGVVVWGDRLRLAQALGNLLANAIEHGGGAVRVHGALRRGVVCIEVDDDGPGLPGSVAGLASRPRAGRGPRGRGLAIALGIAEAHGGTVAAAPVGHGGRVVLTLPAAGG